MVGLAVQPPQQVLVVNVLTLYLDSVNIMKQLNAI